MQDTTDLLKILIALPLAGPRLWQKLPTDIKHIKRFLRRLWNPCHLHLLESMQCNQPQHIFSTCLLFFLLPRKLIFFSSHWYKKTRFSGTGALLLVGIPISSQFYKKRLIPISDCVIGGSSTQYSLALETSGLPLPIPPGEVGNVFLFFSNFCIFLGLMIE